MQIKNVGNGSGFSAKISSIGGKDIVSIASTVTKIENVVFTYDNRTGNVTGLSTQPHGLFEGDIVTVSGLSTDTFRDLDGSHRIGFSTSRFALNIGVGTTGITGIVTSIDVIGDFSPRSVSANDILSLSGIGSTNGLPLTENMLVLNVDSINSKLRVQREFNGVVGVAHSEGQAVTATNR